MTAMRAAIAVGALGIAAAPLAAAQSGVQAVLGPYLIAGGPVTPTPGDRIGADPGVWTPTPDGFRWTWQRCAPGTLACADIPGADGAEYRVTPEDAGWALRALVHPAGTPPALAAPTATSPVVVPGTGPGDDPPGAGHSPDGPAGAGETGDRWAVGVPPVLRVDLGRAAGVSGTLMGPGGPVPPGVLVELRDPAGRPAAATRTTRQGRFRLTVRATRPGVWRIAGQGWIRPLTIRIRPRVHIGWATRAVRVPGTVRIRGAIRPPVAGKLVQLQYLDPGRGWRLWQQVATGRGGRFMLARRLRPNPLAPRFTLRVRVAVPADLGWPFAPTATPTRAVRVR